MNRYDVIVCSKCDNDSCYYGSLFDFFVSSVIGIICHKCGNTNYYGRTNRFPISIEKKENVMGRTRSVCSTDDCTRNAWKDGKCYICYYNAHPDAPRPKYSPKKKITPDEIKKITAINPIPIKGPYIVWLPLGIGYEPRSYQSLDMVTEDINNGTLTTQTLITRKISVKIALVEE